MDPPIKPDESDCCNSGCNPCILDVYEERLQKYNKHLNDGTKNPDPSKNIIDQLKYTDFTLVQKLPCCGDAFIYVFEAAHTIDDDYALQYEPGQHFLLKGYSVAEQNYFTCAYTPIPMTACKKNQFAVLVKLYDGGRMSRIFRTIKISEQMQWRGPYGSYKVCKKHATLLLIAQGVGIAPFYAIIDELLQDDACETIIKLFYCCRDYKDIYLRNELYSFSSYWNFSYDVFLSRPTERNVKYNEVVHERRLCNEDVTNFLQGKSGCNMLICGSDIFMRAIKEFVQTDVDIVTF